MPGKTPKPSGQFTDDSKWVGGAAPVVGDTAKFVTADSFAVSLSEATGVTALGVQDSAIVTITADPGTTLTINDLRVGSPLPLFGGAGDGTLTYTTTLAPTQLIVNSSSVVGGGGNEGTLILSLIDAQFSIGFDVGKGAGFVGAVYFENAAKVSLRGGNIGVDSGNGYLEVTGGAWVLPAGAQQFFNVGVDSGQATVAIYDNGRVSQSDVRIGLFAGAFGDITIDNGQLVAERLLVGADSEGNLDVSNKGTVSATAHTTVAEEAGSIGDFVLTDKDTSLTTGILDVGMKGTGTHEVQSGALVSTGSLVIGRDTGSGVVTVDGKADEVTPSKLHVLGITKVGGGTSGPTGGGRLVISNGGLVEAGSRLWIGAGSADAGTNIEVVVQGDKSTLDLTKGLAPFPGTISVGINSKSKLTIQDGAQVVSYDGDVAASALAGGANGADGSELNITGTAADGTSSTWEIKTGSGGAGGELTLGATTTKAHVHIDDGGLLKVEKKSIRRI